MTLPTPTAIRVSALLVPFPLGALVRQRRQRELQWLHLSDRAPALHRRRQVLDPYWRDRNFRFHIYDLLAPSNRADDLLNEIDRDPTHIFWG
jgi:hypothetical protein